MTVPRNDNYFRNPAFQQQGRKFLHSYGITRLRSCGLESVAKSAEFLIILTLLLGSFAEGWAAFLVTDSLVVDQPDQATTGRSVIGPPQVARYCKTSSRQLFGLSS